MDLRTDANRSTDDESHGMGGRLGEIQLIARQRQLGKDDNPCSLLGCGVDESNVVRDVGLDITTLCDRLSGGDRASVRHVDTSARSCRPRSR